MAAPVVPQRPSRSQKAEPATAAMASADPPLVPLRPARSSSRTRIPLRSPLNDLPTDIDPGVDTASLQNGTSALFRPPSVPSLPSLGQEGMEYVALENPVPSAAQPPPPQEPDEERQVASDLPLHAPKATVPKAPPVRSPSGRRRSSVDLEETLHSLSPTTSRQYHQRPPSSSSMDRQISRPGSSAPSHQDSEFEHGIPVIGVQVPMNPMAGDVQMPHPSGGARPYSAGIGFFSDGSRPNTREGKRRSLHHVPPDSYGLHGHGILPHDALERAWYQRHPEELRKEEHGAHSPALTSDWNPAQMSSEELNKLVRETSSRGQSSGSAAGAIGTPTEAIGYEATGLYTSREQEIEYLPPLHKRRSRGSRPGSAAHAESPLKYSAFPEHALSPTGRASDSEPEDEKYHMKPPSQHQDKYGGAGYDPPTVDLGYEGGNTADKGGWIDEEGTGTPILASDEVEKNPASEYMRPAVSPAKQFNDDEYFGTSEQEIAYGMSGRRSKSGSRSNSRPTSRPGSQHSMSRFQSHDPHETNHTPLEEIEEYEPLFEGDGEDDDDSRPPSNVDRFKQHRGLGIRRFPSRDIWEDTPNSLQLETTVDTPDLPRAPVTKTVPAAFELPGQETLRKGEAIQPGSPLYEAIKRLSSADTRAVIGNNMLVDANKEDDGTIEDVQPRRPGSSRRFPSKDIWEDVPDSANLSAIVGSDKPVVPARPTRVKAGNDASTATASRDVPVVPPRPSAGKGRQPVVPDRPKPQVPSRPARVGAVAQHAIGGVDTTPAVTSPLARTTSLEENGEAIGTPATKVKSAESAKPALKPKPVVPARPSGAAGGSKLAAVKAGFLSDLNSKLGAGPPPTKEEKKVAEEPAEKGPLVDARKGRARGPARRKPAASPTSIEADAASQDVKQVLSISSASTIFHMPNIGPYSIHVGESLQPKSENPAVPFPVEKTAIAEAAETPASLASPLSTNTAGESLLPRSETNEPQRPVTAGSGSPSKAEIAAKDAKARRRMVEAQSALAAHDAARIGHYGDMPDTKLEEPVLVATSSIVPAEPVEEQTYTVTSDAEQMVPDAASKTTEDKQTQTGTVDVSAGLEGVPSSEQKLHVVLGGDAQADSDASGVAVDEKDPENDVKPSEPNSMVAEVEK